MYYFFFIPRGWWAADHIILLWDTKTNIFLKISTEYIRDFPPTTTPFPQLILKKNITQYNFYIAVLSRLHTPHFSVCMWFWTKTKMNAETYKLDIYIYLRNIVNYVLKRIFDKKSFLISRSKFITVSCQFSTKFPYHLACVSIKVWLEVVK